MDLEFLRRWARQLCFLGGAPRIGTVRLSCFLSPQTLGNYRSFLAHMLYCPNVFVRWGSNNLGQCSTFVGFATVLHCPAKSTFQQQKCSTVPLVVVGPPTQDRPAFCLVSSQSSDLGKMLANKIFRPLGRYGAAEEAKDCFITFAVWDLCLCGSATLLPFFVQKCCSVPRNNQSQ